MEQATSTEALPKPKKRLRIGLRGLLGLILLIGLALGWFTWLDRSARQQTSRLAELQRMGVIVNDPFPSRLCWTAMRVMGTDSNTAMDRLAKVLDRGWTFTPRGFNANFLAQGNVPAVVDQLRPFGLPIEVRFIGTGPPELCLFYIDRVPIERLGVPASRVTITEHPSTREEISWDASISISSP